MTENRSEIEKFNRIAIEYSQLHEQSVGASGEPIEYFAQYKIDCLKRLGIGPEAHLLDYGCGIGNLTTLLAQNFSHVTGFDPSTGSIEIARNRLPSVTFYADDSLVPQAAFDVAVLSGVLHHVPVAERTTVMTAAFSKLRLGGRTVIFEHNPYNPLTRRSVAACRFDDDAVLLAPREVRELLQKAGFSRIKQDYIVFFPKPFAWLRPLEPSLRFVFLGAQTMTIGYRD